jgi:endogenous inhibitor of DNA gyrase (YacG/DUF329 family)
MRKCTICGATVAEGYKQHNGEFWCQRCWERDINKRWEKIKPTSPSVSTSYEAPIN